jgi:hypothetical protein
MNQVKKICLIFDLNFSKIQKIISLQYITHLLRFNKKSFTTEDFSSTKHFECKKMFKLRKRACWFLFPTRQTDRQTNITTTTKLFYNNQIILLVEIYHGITFLLFYLQYGGWYDKYVIRKSAFWSVIRTSRCAITSGSCTWTRVAWAWARRCYWSVLLEWQKICFDLMIIFYL